MIWWLLDYFRIAFYAGIVLLSLLQLKQKDCNPLLLAGNLIMAGGGLLALFHSSILRISSALANDIILTPTVIAWFFINLRAFTKGGKC